MSRQEFLTSDVLRLEVEDNVDGRLVNLIPNPDGELGGWGWITPVADTAMYGRVDGPFGVPVLLYQSPSAGGVASHFYSEPAPVVAGHYVAGRGEVSIVEGAYEPRIEILDNAGGVVWSTATSSFDAPNNFEINGFEVPVGGVSARFRFDHFAGYLSSAPPPPGAYIGMSRVVLISSPTPEGAVISGFIPPAYYVDVLGSAHSINIDRNELDVGTLGATILDSALDPAQADSIIKTGRRIRCMARIPVMGFGEADYGEGDYGGTESAWTPIFTGKIARGQASYDYRQRKTTKQVRITLTAVDPTTPLTRVTRAEGVGRIQELPYVLEGCGVPWNVNGSGDQVTTATVVAKNEQAKALDQVAITRDSALGFAWVDRFGVLQAWDADAIGDGPVQVGGVTRLDEADYSDLEIDYDTDRCINEVLITYVRINGGTGETEEVTYGPYRDEESVRINDVHDATFTVQGIDEATLPAYAQAILTANAWPVVRVLSASVPVRQRRAVPKVLMDLYHRIAVVNERAALNEPLRVVGVKHEISTAKWDTSYSFAGEDRVASPQVTPAVPGSSGGQTLSQQLRPIGEVTMWWGSSLNVPPGWLLCNGSSFDPATYPALASHLAGTTLPNFVDRMPIGAGIKNIGTSGEVGDTGALGWRAVYFIIRAA